MNRKIRHVFIIEDDHDIRVTLRQVLETAGCHVLTATNGLSALELLNLLSPPQLIICDLNMPLMDGPSFIRKKRADTKLKDVPMIIISAQKERFCDYPEVTCLPKPLDLDVLISAVEGALSLNPARI